MFLRGHPSEMERLERQIRQMSNEIRRFDLIILRVLRELLSETRLDDLCESDCGWNEGGRC